jgi:hypothetical protein
MKCFITKNIFLEVQVWKHLFTLEHMTFLYWVSLLIPLKNENCKMLLSLTAWLIWSQCTDVCYIWLAEKGKSTNVASYQPEKKYFRKCLPLKYISRTWNYFTHLKMKLQNSDLFLLPQCCFFSHMQIAFLFYSTTLFFIFNTFFYIPRFETRLISYLTLQ